MNYVRVAFLALINFTNPAVALVVEVTPSAQAVKLNDTVLISVGFADVGNGVSVGAADVNVNFDESALSYQGTTFGDPLLGDQFDLAKQHSNSPLATPGTNTINLIETSLDAAATVAQQAPKFTWAKLTFKPLQNGQSQISVTVNSLADSTGMSLTNAIQKAPPAMVKVTAADQNQVPIAIAGINQSVIVGDTVYLDGTGSYDPDHAPSPLTYKWQQSGGPNVTLSNRTSVSPSFSALQLGAYRFTLTVNDGKADSQPASVSINATSNVGTGGDQSLAIVPSKLDFGTIPAKHNASIFVTLQNVSGQPLKLTQSSPDAPFNLKSGACSGKLLPASGACKLAYTFAPSQEGQFSSNVTITYGNTSTYGLQLSGIASTTVPAPQIESIQPTEIGAQGTSVIIGQGFSAFPGKVLFGNKAAKITAWTDSLIIASFPPLPASTYPVTVVTKDRQHVSATAGITVMQPTLDSLAVSTGAAGSSIPLSGRYFGIAKPKVIFISGKVQKIAKLTGAYSDTSLTAQVPKLKAGSYQVSIKNTAGTSNSQTFQVQ